MLNKILKLYNWYWEVWSVIGTAILLGFACAFALGVTFFLIPSMLTKNYSKGGKDAGRIIEPPTIESR